MKDNLPFIYGVVIYSLIFISSCAISSKNNLKNTHLVTRVIDGDTFCIEDDLHKEIKIRLIGVDAPETRRTKNKKVGHYGQESALFLEKLILNKHVSLEHDIQKRDVYGRILAYVYLKNTFINDYLVQLGYCRVATFPPNVKYQDLFIRSEKEGRKENRGLWNRD